MCQRWGFEYLFSLQLVNELFQVCSFERVEKKKKFLYLLLSKYKKKPSCFPDIRSLWWNKYKGKISKLNKNTNYLWCSYSQMEKYDSISGND